MKKSVCGPATMRARSTCTLVKAAARGGRTAMANLIQRFDGFLVAAVRRGLGPARFARHGEDVLQDVRLKAVRSFPKVRARDRASLLAWFRSIARSVILDWHKRRRARKAIPSRKVLRLDGTNAPDLPAGSPAPDSDLLNHEEVARLEEAIERTDPRYQEVLRFYLVGRAPSAPEIAAFLGKEPDASRKFFQRALADLKRVIEAESSGSSAP